MQVRFLQADQLFSRYRIMERITAKTIEQQVADAILQQPVGKVRLRGVDYPVNHPSPATLIMVSALCSDLPPIDGKGNVLTEVLRTASGCKVVGQIVATLILGAKRIKEGRMVETTRRSAKKCFWRRLLGRFDTLSTVTEKVAEIDYLAEILLEDFTPSQLRELAQRLFFYSEVVDFFGLTTSLSVANLLRSTREVVTASGE